MRTDDETLRTFTTRTPRLAMVRTPNGGNVEGTTISLPYTTRFRDRSITNPTLLINILLRSLTITLETTRIKFPHPIPSFTNETSSQIGWISRSFLTLSVLDPQTLSIVPSWTTPLSP